MGEPTREIAAGAHAGPRQIFEGKASPSDKPDLISRVDKIEEQLKKSKDTIKSVGQVKVDAELLDRARRQLGVPKDDGSREYPTAAFTARETDTKEFNALYEKFINQGYDKLNPKEQAQVEAQFLDALKTHPLMADITSELGKPANRKVLDAYFKDKCNDPEFRQLVKAHIDATTEQGVHLSDAELAQAQLDVEQRKRAEKKAIDQYDRAETKRKDNQQILDDNFDSSGAPKGDWAIFLTNQKANDLTHENLVLEQHTLEITYQAAADALTKKPKDVLLQTAMMDAERTLNAKKTEIENSDKNKRLKLQTRINQAGNQKKQFDDEVTAALQQKNDAEIARKRAETNLIQAVADKERAETVYVDSLKKVVQEATTDWIDAKAVEGVELYDKQHEEEAAQAKKVENEGKETKHSAFQKNYSEHLHTRYGSRRAGDHWFDRGEKYRYNDLTIDSDYNSVFTDGPKTTVYRNHQGDAIKAGLITAGASEADFYKALKDNGIDTDEFVADVTSTIMANKIAIGGIPRDEAAYIIRSKWGQDAIQKGLEKNSTFRKTMEELEKLDIHPKGVFSRTIAELSKRPWLLAILFSPFVLMGTSMKDITEMQ